MMVVPALSVSYIATSGQKARVLVLLLGVLMLLSGLIFSLMTGSSTYSPSQSIAALLNITFGVESELVNKTHIMVMENIRLPRALLAIITGALLALSGCLMQGLFRNPLADPGIIGVSSGASLGAATAMVLSSSFAFGSYAWLEGALFSQAWVSLFAFAGGVVATFMVHRIGTGSQGTSVTVMLLAGIAIAALSSAGVSLLSYISDDITLRNISFWQMGSISGGGWIEVQLLSLVLLFLLVVVPVFARSLNILLLGEPEARYLGIDVQQLKTRLILLTALATGAAVAATGLIGFVGLVVPHLVRLVLGPDHRVLIPASALFGGALLLYSDFAARLLLWPVELPLGLVTAFVGAPFFIFLLLKQRRHMV